MSSFLGSTKQNRTLGQSDTSIAVCRAFLAHVGHLWTELSALIRSESKELVEQCRSQIESQAFLKALQTHRRRGRPSNRLAADLHEVRLHCRTLAGPWVPLFRDSNVSYTSANFGRQRHRLGSYINPKGPGSNDCSLLERCINVITSTPFIAIGLRQSRKSSNGDIKYSLYNASLMAVGLAATAYHSSSGRLRSILRKGDYYTISCSSLALTHVLHPDFMSGKLGRLILGTSLAITPFKPTLVTASHAVVMEAEYLRQASRNPSLRTQHRKHSLAMAAGLSLFFIEDSALEHNFHWTHSMWHCLASYSMASITPLLNYKQQAEVVDF